MVKYVLSTPLTLPLVLLKLINPITFVPKVDSKGCPMDSFNIAFSSVVHLITFIPKGLIESKVCPIGLL